MNIKDKCRNCIGTCCIITGKVYFTEEEFKNLKDNKIDVSRIKKIGTNYYCKIEKKKPCIFYREYPISEHCSIYEFRPKICRRYRIGTCDIKRIQNES